MLCWLAANSTLLSLSQDTQIVHLGAHCFIWSIQTLTWVLMQVQQLFKLPDYGTGAQQLP